MIRFSCCLGNTIYLSDMSFDNNCIWICDLEGNVRKVAGVGKCQNFQSKLGQLSECSGVFYNEIFSIVAAFPFSIMSFSNHLN